ncbi:MAG: hypothetical protein ACOCU6_02875 [Nanoarchaeota archaeon]
MDDDSSYLTGHDSYSNDISSLQEQVRNLERTQRQASKRSEAILFGQLVIGSVFLAISFLLLITRPSLFEGFSILASIVSLSMLIPVVFELLFSSKERFWNVIGAMLLLLISGLVITLWMVVLKEYTLIITLSLLGMFILFFVWILFHLLMRYIRTGIFRISFIPSLSSIISLTSIAMFSLKGSALSFSFSLGATIVFAVVSIEYSRRIMQSMLRENSK